jgi:hypothetical protein
MVGLLMNWKGFGRRDRGLIEVLPGIFLELLKKTTRNVRMPGFTAEV